MHSGRIVIANRSAVWLKGALSPFSKAIKNILNHGNELSVQNYLMQWCSYTQTKTCEQTTLIRSEFMNM